MEDPQCSGAVTEKPDFETALGKLQATVKNLESGELGLEQALSQFEEGVRLTRICQQHIASAEQRVEILMKPNPEASQPELQPFSPSRS